MTKITVYTHQKFKMYQLTCYINRLQTTVRTQTTVRRQTIVNRQTRQQTTNRQQSADRQQFIDRQDNRQQTKSADRQDNRQLNSTQRAAGSQSRYTFGFNTCVLDPIDPSVLLTPNTFSPLAQ